MIVDLNGDGAGDIAMPDGYPIPDVSVLLGHGDRSFGATAEFTTGWNPRSLVAADLNGDGNLDLVTGDLGRNGGPVGRGISIMFGAGDGTFESEVEIGDPASASRSGARRTSIVTARSTSS